MQNVLEYSLPECPKLPLMNLAEEKPSWGVTKAFCTLGVTIKYLKLRIKSLTVKNTKTQLRYEITWKFEIKTEKLNFEDKLKNKSNKIVNLHPTFQRMKQDKSNVTNLLNNVKYKYKRYSLTYQKMFIAIILTIKTVVVIKMVGSIKITELMIKIIVIIIIIMNADKKRKNEKIWAKEWTI